MLSTRSILASIILPRDAPELPEGIQNMRDPPRDECSRYRPVAVTIQALARGPVSLDPDMAFGHRHPRLREGLARRHVLALERDDALD